MQPAARELLSALAPVLSVWGRWYLFGAQAVIGYGVPRLSADVDVTLALVPDAPDRFAREMEAAGFQLQVPDPAFVLRTRVMPFIHQATGMKLTLIPAGGRGAKICSGRTPVNNECMPPTGSHTLIGANVSPW